ncbi:pilin [Photobacterium carnosum]|uniref:pilin n=1 Tax=Photobacterium carnosum TaxID=2023717 RepID=UPI001E31669B|nr:pilin [Photobacterium carnosum]MCD9514916.1 prepilin-type N-terminal cleavage/methylation domain-containing protein [Photobacterium carnosum]
MKKQQGFTLIELMIVVAIIGVLSAIAIPAYKDYVTKSEASSALATLKALVTPAELYIQETAPITATTALNLIGTQAKANSLGDISLGANAIIFTFNDTSSLEKSTLTLERNTTSGWACEASEKIPDIDGCPKAQS